VRAIEARLASFGRSGPLGENNRRQAMLPRGAVVLENPHGTAPGFVALRADGRFVASLPGPPGEMKPMLAEKLVPWLVARYGLRDAIFTRTLHTVGLPEAEVDARIEPLFRTLENPKIAVLAHGGLVDVKIMAKARDRAAAAAAIAPVEAELRERIGAGIFGVDGETLAGRIVERLAALGATLATAESITGGAIADAIVRTPGASRAFLGGIVAYDNAVKQALLGVDEATLREYGAVSEQTAVAMARGACAALGTSFALATTGIAGPTGATEGKPVGLTFITLARRDGTCEVRRVTFPGEREDVRRRATLAALNLIWRKLDKEESVPARV